jgi:hypothetical protein
MRRHKAVARIFLLLSIVNFALAGVAQIPTTHETRVDLVTGAEDVTEASEREHTQSGVLPELLGRPSTAGHLQSRFDLIPARSFNTESLSIDSEDPEGKKFFNEELIRKMKEYLVLGTIAGIFTGVANGIQKEILGTVSPGAYVLFFFYLHPSPSCQHSNDVGHKHILTMVYLSTTIGRSIEPLIEHHGDKEDLVSRSLSNMRDGDLQMLSMFSRRMLNRLD